MTYPSAGSANRPQPNTGAWETMPIPPRLQADIHTVEFGLTNSDCWEVFDNLSYQR